MWLTLRMVLLLSLVNFAPPLLTMYLGDRWRRPVDGGRTFADGRPWLGSHKTIRGLAGALLMGAAAGGLLGFTCWEGFLVGSLAMAGDLISSFIKRRMGFAEGSVVPGLDQVFEGVLPFLIMAPRYSLGPSSVLSAVLLFSGVAVGGSWFFKRILLRKPSPDYPRSVHPLVRLRELRSCGSAVQPFHPFLFPERYLYYHLFMKSVFRILGIYDRGMRNAGRVSVKHVVVRPRGLPGKFEGFTILLLSDLHLDGVDGLAESLCDLLAPFTVDLCLLGGDYRMEKSGSYNLAMRRLERVVGGIHAREGIFGVLGNHDCLEMIPDLEDMGVVVLLNDAVSIEREGERVWVVGIDDPHYYRSHNMDQAFAEVGGGEFSLVLAHSPEAFRDAEMRGASLYLCGHTHAGQVHMPKLGPLFTHSRSPRRLIHGLWQEGQMLGYTSSGAGVSGLSVRYGTEGEAVRIVFGRPDNRS